MIIKLLKDIKRRPKEYLTQLAFNFVMIPVLWAIVGIMAAAGPLSFNRKFTNCYIFP